MSGFEDIIRKGDLEGVRKYIKENKVKKNKLNDGLTTAAVNNYLPIVKELLANNAPIQYSLYNASRYCCISPMRELISFGAYVNIQGYEVKTPLHNACSSPLGVVSDVVQIEAIKLLVANGADPTIKDAFGKTPFQQTDNEVAQAELTQAIEDHKQGKLESNKVNQNAYYLQTIKKKQLWQYASDGDLEGLKRRIEKKGNTLVNGEIDERNKNTALMYACWRNHLSIVQVLLENGANVNAKDIHDETALIQASCCGYLPIVQILLEYGADVNDKSKEGETSLTYASKYGHLEVAKVLIENGARINDKNTEGSSSLMFASKLGHLEVVKLLIAKGTNINDKNNKGNNSLVLASEHGHLEILRVLMNSGANINDKNNEGNNGLITALINDHLELVKALINKGANINEKNKLGETALMICAKKGKLELSTVLIKRGVNINDEDHGGKTAMFYVKNFDILRELLKTGANINHRDKCGDTVLHINCNSYDNIKNIRILIAYGADIAIKNNKGKTAFELIPSYDKYNRDGYIEALKDKKKEILFPFNFNEDSIPRLFSLKKVYLVDEPIAQYLDLIEHELSKPNCPVEELILNWMKLDETQLLTIGEAIANNPHTSIHTVKLQYLQSKAAETILTHQAISAIFKIKSLTTLDISRNEYKQIPIGVDKIQSHLKIIICNNSKLPFTIPANIKDQGDDALFGYLRDLYKGSEKCSSARLTLVGSGFAGKTTLVKKLHDYVNSTFYSSDVTASTRTRTDGVEVTSLILIIQLIQPIKISNLLSNLWNLTIPEDFSNLELWLNSIYSKSPNAPILVVGTHSDMKQAISLTEMKSTFSKLLSKLDLQGKKPNIAGYHRVSATRTSEGIKELLQSISDSVMKLDRMKNLFPTSYTQLSNKILLYLSETSSKSPILPIEKFTQEIAMKSSDAFNSSYSDSKASLTRAIDFLCDEGQILRFDDLIIIDPIALNSLFTTVLSVRGGIVKDGFLDHKHLQTLLEKGCICTTGAIDSIGDILCSSECNCGAQCNCDSKCRCKIPKTDYQLVLQMLRHFNISVLATLSLELIPCELSIGQPEPKHWKIIPDSSSYQFHFTWKFVFDFLPPAFVPQLFISLLQRSDVEKWFAFRHCLLILFNDSIHRLRVDSNSYSRTVTFSLRTDLVQGISPLSEFQLQYNVKLFRAQISSAIQKIINQHFPSEKNHFNEFIVCPTCICSFEIDEPGCLLVSEIEKYNNENDLVRCPVNTASSTKKIWLFGCAPKSEGLNRAELMQVTADQDKAKIPRLFILAPDPEKSLKDRAAVFLRLKRMFRVHLVCEYPHDQHVLPLYEHEGYQLTTPAKNFLAQHASNIASAVKFLSTGASYAGVPYSSEIGNVSGHISKFLNWVSEDDTTLKSQIQAEYEKFQRNPKSTLQQLAQGPNLREFENLLKEKDPAHQWGKLTKVNTKNGFYWLCPNHVKEFEHLKKVAKDKLSTDVIDPFTNLFASNSASFSSSSTKYIKHALVIGNRYYTGSIQNYKISDVSNASNDSSDVTYVLRQCGFQVVHGTDVGKNKFFQLLNNFVTATKSSAQQITKQQRREKRKEKGKGIYLSGLDLNDKDQEDNTSLVLNELNLEEEDINKKSTEPVKTIMFFYFSGHGLQVDGVNYLVPVNAVINSIDDVPKQCFNLNTLFESLKEVPNNFTNIIILDCCRNNPSPNNSIITKPGLAVIDDSVFTTSHGSLILFATQSGRYASDGIENQNGVFTKHLLAALTNPSLKVGDFKEHIAAEMAKDPNNTTNQRPTAISAGLLNISLHS